MGGMAGGVSSAGGVGQVPASSVPVTAAVPPGAAVAPTGAAVQRTGSQESG